MTGMDSFRLWEASSVSFQVLLLHLLPPQPYFYPHPLLLGHLLASAMAFLLFFLLELLVTSWTCELYPLAGSFCRFSWRLRSYFLSQEYSRRTGLKSSGFCMYLVFVPFSSPQFLLTYVTPELISSSLTYISCLFRELLVSCWFWITMLSLTLSSVLGSSDASSSSFEYLSKEILF